MPRLADEKTNSFSDGMQILSGFSDGTQSHSPWDVLYWFLLFPLTGLLVFIPGVFSLLPDVGHYKPVTPKRLIHVCHEIFLQSQFPASATDTKAPTSSSQMSQAPDLVRQFTNKPGQTRKPGWVLHQQTNLYDNRVDTYSCPLTSKLESIPPSFWTKKAEGFAIVRGQKWAPPKASPDKLGSQQPLEVLFPPALSKGNQKQQLLTSAPPLQALIWAQWAQCMILNQGHCCTTCSELPQHST